MTSENGCFSGWGGAGGRGVAQKRKRWLNHTLLAAALSDAYLNRRACASSLLQHYHARASGQARFVGMTEEGYWRKGKLEFGVVSDAPIPEFGQIASRLCPDALIVYYGGKPSAESDYHCYVKGKRVQVGGVDEETKQRFMALIESQEGIILPGPLDALFADEPPPPSG